MSATVVGAGFDRASQGIAAQRPKPDQPILRLFAWLERQAVIVHHDQRVVTLHDRPMFGEVERHDRNVLQHDVVPDIEFGPVRQREHANGFVRPDAGVEEIPQLGTLVPRVPDVSLRADRENTFLGPALLFVPSGAAKGCIEAMAVKRLLERFGFHDLGMKLQIPT